MTTPSPADEHPLPTSLDARARAALSDAGIGTLADLRRWARSDVAALDGITPNQLRILGDAMEDAGWHFADEDTAPV